MTENPKHLFGGEHRWLDDVSIDEPIAQAVVHKVDEYDDLYLKAAKDAQAIGATEKETVYRFLGQLCTIHLSFQDITVPYVPQMSGPDGRSCQPSDLSVEDLAAIERICQLTARPALKARLYDFLFLRRKDEKGRGDYKSAIAAIDSFIASANEVVGKGHAWDVTSALKRALQLGRLTGRGGDAAKRAVDATIAIVRTASTSPTEPLFCAGVRLLNEFGIGDPLELMAPMNIAAEHFLVAGEEHRARTHFEVILELNRRMDDKDGELLSYKNIGNSFVREAEKRATQSGSSNMAAASILKDGIEALRQGKEEDGRIKELKAQLQGYQQKIGDELGTYSSSIDISQSVQVAIDHVKGLSFNESILRLAFGVNETDITALREAVLGNANEAPLLHILHTTILGSKGRTRAVQKGLHNLKGEEYDLALRQHMFAHASRFDWSMRAQAFINPARQQVTTEHHPQLEDLVPLVIHNPFIPKGHEGIVARGLLAGFYGDFLVASHLLVPQFENSIRYLLETEDVDVTNLMSDGTEPLKLLGALLSKEETERFLGAGHCFELRGILADESGYNFRHRIAHGMVSEGECYGPPGLNSWWLMLRLCIHPLIPRLSVVDQPAPTT